MKNALKTTFKITCAILALVLVCCLCSIAGIWLYYNTGPNIETDFQRVFDKNRGQLDELVSAAKIDVTASGIACRSIYTEGNPPVARVGGNSTATQNLLDLTEKIIANAEVEPGVGRVDYGKLAVCDRQPNADSSFNLRLVLRESAGLFGADGSESGLAYFEQKPKNIVGSIRDSGRYNGQRAYQSISGNWYMYRVSY